MTDTLTDWSVSSSCIPVWHITYVTYLTHQTQSGTYRSGISIIIENILFEGLGESILPIIDFFPSKLFLHQKHGHEHRFCLDSRNWLLGKTCLLVIYDQFIENFSERWVAIPIYQWICWWLTFIGQIFKFLCQFGNNLSFIWSLSSWNGFFNIDNIWLSSSCSKLNYVPNWKILNKPILQSMEQAT